MKDNLEVKGRRAKNDCAGLDEVASAKPVQACASICSSCGFASQRRRLRLQFPGLTLLPSKQLAGKSTAGCKVIARLYRQG